MAEAVEFAQLVKRARSGLVAAAEARDAACASIRDVLLTAHDERRRPSEHAVRHLRGCDACREFREGLKATRGRLRALVPPVGLGPLAGVLHALGGATGGEGLARPRSETGKTADHTLRMYQIARADHKRWQRTGRKLRTTQIDSAARPLDAPVVISLGMLCKRR